MNGTRFAANVLAAFLAMLFAYVTTTGGEDPRTHSQACEELLHHTSWGELSTNERELLLNLFLSLPRGQFLESSASGFVERQGYRITEIMGPISLEEQGRPVQVAFREGSTYALSLPSIEAPLFPGLYWTKGFGSAWTVLTPGGETVTYWVDREL